MPKILLDDIKQTKISALLYGPPNAGKTYLAGSALLVPELRPVFIMDCEGGLASIPHFIRGAGEEVILWSLQGNSDYQMLRSALFDESPIKTVIIDGLGELYNFMMEQELAAAGREGGTPQLQDYGKVRTRMSSLFRKARTVAKRHLIVTCHDEIDKDETTGGMYISPALTGKLGKEISQFFSIQAYLTTETKVRGGELTEKNYIAQIDGYGRVRAKFRSPEDLPGRLENTNMAEIYDMVIRPWQEESTSVFGN